MTDFQDLFINQNKSKIVHKGQTIYALDFLPLAKGDTILIKLISHDSPYPQAIDLYCRSKLEYKGKSHTLLRLWVEHIENNNGEVTVSVLEDGSKVSVRNIYEFKNHLGGTMVIPGNKNSAMKILKDGEKKIYYCNGGDADEDFDDLVFSIEVIKHK